MAGLLDADGRPAAAAAAAAAPARRLFVALLSDGLTLVGEEADGRWYYPTKLLPASPQQMIPMIVLQAFANSESMPAAPDRVLAFSYDVLPAVRSMFESFKDSVRMAKAGLVRQ